MFLTDLTEEEFEEQEWEIRNKILKGLKPCLLPILDEYKQEKSSMKIDYMYPEFNNNYSYLKLLHYVYENNYNAFVYIQFINEAGIYTTNRVVFSFGNINNLDIDNLQDYEYSFEQVYDDILHRSYFVSFKKKTLGQKIINKI